MCIGSCSLWIISTGIYLTPAWGDVIIFCFYVYFFFILQRRFPLWRVLWQPWKRGVVGVRVGAGFFSCLSQEIWNSCLQTKMNKEPYSSIHSTQYERQETWYLIKRDLLRDLNKVNHLLSFALLSLNVRCKLIIIVGIMIKKNVTCTWVKCKYVSLSHWLLISQCSLAQKSKLDEINITKIKPAISCCYHVNIM